MPRIGDDLSLEPSLDEEDYIHEDEECERDYDEYDLEYDPMDYSNLVGGRPDGIISEEEFHRKVNIAHREMRSKD